MASYVAKSPVLLLGWTRPDRLRESLRAITRVKPSQLFLSLDGPRDDTDRVLIEKSVLIVKNSIDWSCELQVDIAESHLGLRHAVVSGISWFFESVDEGIIVEDDCVGSEDFFRFCDEMLLRFRHQPEVLHISGDNSMSVGRFRRTSYSFIGYPHIWGWATWKRAWSKYDDDLAKWQAHHASRTIESVFFNKTQQKVWEPVFDALAFQGVPDTWDWRWTATVFIEKGLCVQPHRNLVSNIGFGEGATHTNRFTYRSNAQTARVFPLIHPVAIKKDTLVERQLVRRQRRDFKRKTSAIAIARESLFSGMQKALRAAGLANLWLRIMTTGLLERMKVR